VLDKSGRKMSKSLKNTVDPIEIMSKFGADATRWYFYSAVAVGNEYRFDPAAVQDVVRRFVLILWNTYGFFTNYARLDGFDPGQPAAAASQRAVLDRWLLAELFAVISDVGAALDAYDPTTAARRLEAFVLDISTWYVRRSRRRFWKSESDSDKLSAYQTLHRALVTLAQLLAPFTPFLAESIYRNLTDERSVHLADFPQPRAEDVDARLEEGLARELVRNIQSLRKQSGFNIEDRIVTYYEADGQLGRALERHGDYVKSETLSVELRPERPGDLEGLELKVEGEPIWLGLKPAV